MLWRKKDWAISLMIVVAVITALPYLSLAADPPSPSSLNPDNGQSLAGQIKSIRAELEQLGAKKAALVDQVSGLRAQKQIARLTSRNQDLIAKIQDAQKKNQTAKVSELTTRQSTLQNELSLWQDLANLYPQLQTAHASLQKDAAKNIEAQIQAKRDAIKALNPPKAASATPVAVQPVATPKPEDPDIQALLDQIKAVDDQIKQDREKLESLKKPATSPSAPLPGKANPGK